MSWFTRTFTYSVGKKIIMSLTGLFLVLFLIEHLIGNLLLLAGDKGVAYMEYSHWATNNIFIRTVEIFLFAGFIFHIIDGVVLTIQNKRARPNGYVMNARNANSSWLSRNMILSGLVLFAFLLLHLYSFFYPYRIVDHNTNLFDIAVHKFQNPIFTGFYLLSFFLLALHLGHGFASAFQTLGLRHPKYYSGIKTLGWIIAIGLNLGFAVIALYFLLIYQSPN